MSNLSQFSFFFRTEVVIINVDNEKMGGKINPNFFQNKLLQCLLYTSPPSLSYLLKGTDIFNFVDQKIMHRSYHSCHICENKYSWVLTGILRARDKSYLHCARQLPENLIIVQIPIRRCSVQQEFYQLYKMAYKTSKDLSARNKMQIKIWPDFVQTNSYLQNACVNYSLLNK